MLLKIWKYVFSYWFSARSFVYVLKWNTDIDQKLNSLHGLLNCEIGGFDCRVITTKYRTSPLNTRVSPIVQCVGPCNLFRSVWSMFVYNSSGGSLFIQRFFLCQQIRLHYWFIVRIDKPPRFKSGLVSSLYLDNPNMDNVTYSIEHIM